LTPCGGAATARHGKVAPLVERIRELNNQKHSCRRPASKLHPVEPGIATGDQGTRELVYELYGMTGEGCKIVEAS
jgi:hypothetical protein